MAVQDRRRASFLRSRALPGAGSEVRAVPRAICRQLIRSAYADPPIPRAPNSERTRRARLGGLALRAGWARAAPAFVASSVSRPADWTGPQRGHRSLFALAGTNGRVRPLAGNRRAGRHECLPAKQTD